MSERKSRKDFFDGDDTAKWSGEAKRQMQVLPPGAEKSFSWPLYESWVNKLDLRGTAVDFGCGTAYYRPLFSNMNYIGVDQNPDMILSSKVRWPQGQREKFYQTPLNKITDNFPELSGVGDAGLFVTVLQHNHYEVADEIMQQVCRVLKSGATLFLFEATYIETYYPPETRKRYGFPDIDPNRLDSIIYGAAIYTEKGWRNFFDKFGFDVLDYDGGCGYVAKRR